MRFQKWVGTHTDAALRGRFLARVIESNEERRQTTAGRGRAFPVLDV